MNKRPSLMFAASLLLLAVLACAIPGRQTASLPTPTLDPAELNVIVAETVSAVLQQTALAPTATQQPAVQLPATTTSQPPDAEPLGTTTPLPQSSITNQSDGNAFFVDEKSGFNLLVPPGWLPVRIDQLEYYDAFSLPQAADPNFQAALLSINNLDPKVYRLFVFDLQDGHLQNGFVNNINIICQPDSSISLKTDEDLKKTAGALPSLVAGLTVTSTSISKTTNGILIGVILSDIAGKKSDGTDLALFQKQVLLNVKGGTLVITFTTEQGIKDATLPSFDTLVNSIKLGE